MMILKDRKIKQPHEDPKPGVEIQSEKLIDYIKTKTSSFKTPSKIYFADAIPKSTVGKILKKELREQAKKI